MHNNQFTAVWQKVRLHVCNKTATMKEKFKATLHKGRMAIKRTYGNSKDAIASLYGRLLAISPRVKHSVLAVLVLALLITSTSVYAYIGSFTYVVYIDDQEVGYVTTETVIPDFIAGWQAQQSELAGADLITEQEIEVTREQRKGIKEDDEAVKQYIREEVELGVYAYMVMINDKPILPVATTDDYNQVIEELKNIYITDAENAVIQAVVLSDKLEARLTLVQPTDIYSVEKTVELLCYGTDKRETYIVSRGDSLWSIAHETEMSVTDIKNANPELVSDKLMPGDQLSLVVSEPMVNVSVTQDIVVSESIAYETETKEDKTMYKGTSKVLQAGKKGSKEITYRVTQENGREVKRTSLAEKVIKEPVTKIIAKGTKAVPVPSGGSSGTGRFLWPVAGRGTITSRYGYRWGGFHRGLDIATPSGTAVLAADSGRVTQSGWQGAYGILVTINHGNGYVTKYAHNSATLVTVGQNVQKGQQIARSGSTGNSTGPHLHFEVIKNGSNVNPLSYL